MTMGICGLTCLISAATTAPSNLRKCSIAQHGDPACEGDKQEGGLFLWSDNSDQVAAPIKELLSLNRSQSSPMAHPPSAEEPEQRQSKRKRVRQELVLALSLRGL
jgi:hypothetical protein